MLPWLMGLIEVFAWIATVLFSLIWAVIGYFIGGAILGDSSIAGVIVAVVIFICSFFAHKVFAGFSNIDSRFFMKNCNRNLFFLSVIAKTQKCSDIF